MIVDAAAGGYRGKREFVEEIEKANFPSQECEEMIDEME